MRLAFFSIGAVFAIAAGIAAASAADDTAALAASLYGPYIGLGAGANFPEKADDHLLQPPPAPAHTSFGAGYNVVGAFGWTFHGGLRAEAEIGWREAPVDRMNGRTWSGHEQIASAMANLVYEFRTGRRLTPYVGGGIGAGRLRYHNVTNGFVPTTYTGHDTNFQWQLIGGVSMPVAPRLALFAEYRYIGIDGNHIDRRFQPATDIIDHDDRSHNVLVGLRYFFRAPVEKAAAPPPPPPPERAAAPPPPPAPATPKFEIFFDFDRSNLLPDARAVVRQAADAAKGKGKVVIHVTGHTDTVGTDSYNLALSKRRADAVKAELVRLGISADEINEAWVGKSDLLVPTGDQVREPQNRRVEIVYE